MSERTGKWLIGAIAAALIILGYLETARAQTTFTMPPPAGVTVGGMQVVTTCGAAAGLVAGNLAFASMNTDGEICTAGGGGGLSVTDQAAWTQGVSSFTPGGGVFNDAATLSSGEQGTYRLTTKRAQIIDVDTSGNALYTAMTSAIPAGTNRIGYASDDPCANKTKTNKQFTTNGTSSVELVAVSGSTTIYVCSLAFIVSSASKVAFTTGTGTACATNNAAVIGSTTANIANSMSFAANGGLTLGSGAGTIAKGAASSALCMINSVDQYTSGNLTYVQE